MSASPVLVDSSFYIRSLRQGQDPLRLLALTAAGRDIAVCGVVRCEVGRGIVQLGLRAKISNFWDVCLNIPTDDRLWAEAEETLWNLDRKGVCLPLSDIVIACSARRIGAVLLTFDQHFRDVPGLTVIDRPPV